MSTGDAVKARRVAVLQSNYIPWKGYFDLIHDVDVFVFYDDVQFTKSDWRNRNRIKTSQGTQWLSIPTGIKIHQRIDEVELTNTAWQARHWRTLLMNYGKCAHFGRYRDYFERVYLDRQWRSLSELNQTLIKKISIDFLGIRTEFADSSLYAPTGQKQDRLLSLLGQIGATCYVSGPAAQGYIAPERFSDSGIGLVWKDYGNYPEYAQRFPPFDHRVSILDLLFNAGPDAPWYIWGWRDSADRAGWCKGAATR